MEGWRKEEERVVSLWVVVERKGVEFKEEGEEEEDDDDDDDACGKSMSLEEAVAEESAMVLENWDCGEKTMFVSVKSYVCYLVVLVECLDG